MKEKLILILSISVMILPVYAINEIPIWVKNNAGWWAEGSIDDETFIQGIQFLIKIGVIAIDENNINSKKIKTNLVSDFFDVWVYENEIYLEEGVPVSRNFYFDLMDGQDKLYNEIGFLNNKTNTIVITPVFTSSAYSEKGFYDFYQNKCDSCTTVQIIENNFLEFFVASQMGYRILDVLGYDSITDIDLDKNPNIIKKYDTVILLHNEYVTQTMFDAITKHPNVLYLYPNALYAKISVDYEKNEITLIRGHGYPESEINNGFNWEYDNTHPYEYDENCLNWEFYDIPNGKMLNCYPEHVLPRNIELLKEIKKLSS